MVDPKHHVSACYIDMKCNDSRQISLGHGILGAFTSLWCLPGDVLSWNLNVASLAMDAASEHVSDFVFYKNKDKLTSGS